MPLTIYADMEPWLIPSLPDVVSIQIIARVPRVHYRKLKLVSRRWKSSIASYELFRVRKELKKTEEWLYILAQSEEQNDLFWYALDPMSGIWQRLPPVPNFPPREESKKVSGLKTWNFMDSCSRIVDAITGWLGHSDANHTTDRIPFSGALGCVNGCLYVLGGLSKESVMSCVWKYDPILNIWQEVSSMTTARAFCKTCHMNGKLYVVGGVNWVRDGDRGSCALAPLRSAEVFDPVIGRWDPIPNMPYSRFQSLSTSPDILEKTKPIATGLSCYKGKLCVPQSLYCWLGFYDLAGEVYDPMTNSWAAMPGGMSWKWPAEKAGTKLSVVVNEELYALDHSTSPDNSNTTNIKIYDHIDDSWNVVIEKVPMLNNNDVECPYLLAAFLGKLHLILKDANGETVVMEADLEKSATDILLASSPSTSSSSTVPEVEADVWKVIATKYFGGAKLVSCEVLDA